MSLIRFDPSNRDLDGANSAYGRETITSISMDSVALFIAYVNNVTFAGLTLTSFGVSFARTMATSLVAAFKHAIAPILLELQKERDACDALKRQRDAHEEFIKGILIISENGANENARELSRETMISLLRTHLELTRPPAKV